jgi:uncharacterized protein with HEPN domain
MFDTFVGDWVKQRAVERGLEITSQASRHVPTDLKALARDIPWRQITAIGNLLRHEYQRADVETTWNIINEHPSALSVAIEELIADTERQVKG